MKNYTHIYALNNNIAPDPLRNLFAIWQGRGISRQTFYSHVHQFSQQLPDAQFAVNLCNDRYLFCVSFFALLLRGQTNLLPPNKTENTLFELSRLYPNSYCIFDQIDDPFPTQKILIDGKFNDELNYQFPQISTTQTAAINFTSGSTGTPKAIEKSWGVLCEAAQLALHHFKLKESAYLVVSTVPSQHMYGLETSVFWPYHSNLSVYSGETFYPEDIRRAIMSATIPCLLFSTPAHLKALIENGHSWNNIETVFCSTAPLIHDLAKRIEQQLEAPLLELFGSTETMSFASRRPSETKYWTLYPSVKLKTNTRYQTLQTNYFKREIKLDDELELCEDGTFHIVGRRSDLVKVVGKRTSLSELNNHLNQINGVHDGAFYVPQDNAENRRLGALVVSDVCKSKILSELKRMIDPVFLPRPLYKVPQIPRTEVGKIKDTELQQLISTLKNGIPIK